MLLLSRMPRQASRPQTLPLLRAPLVKPARSLSRGCARPALTRQRRLSSSKAVQQRQQLHQQMSWKTRVLQRPRPSASAAPALRPLVAQLLPRRPATLPARTLLQQRWALQRQRQGQWRRRRGASMSLRMMSPLLAKLRTRGARPPPLPPPRLPRAARPRAAQRRSVQSRRPRAPRARWGGLDLGGCRQRAVRDGPVSRTLGQQLHHSAVQQPNPRYLPWSCAPSCDPACTPCTEQVDGVGSEAIRAAAEHNSFDIE